MEHPHQGFRGSGTAQFEQDSESSDESEAYTGRQRETPRDFTSKKRKRSDSSEQEEDDDEGCFSTDETKKAKTIKNNDEHSSLLSAAKDMLAEGDYDGARQIYEQLLFEDNVEALFALADMDTSKMGIRNLSIEQHRAFDARVAVILERAFGIVRNSKTTDDSAYQRVPKGFQGVPQMRDPQMRDPREERGATVAHGSMAFAESNPSGVSSASGSSAQQTASKRDSPISELASNLILSAWRPRPFDIDKSGLHDRLDQLQQREMNDFDEGKTLAQRRFKFAEVGVLLETIMMDDEEEMEEDVCLEARYRLARMYAFRLGVDGSDEIHSAHADAQAMEYLEYLIEKEHSGGLYLAALLKLQGRAAAYSSSVERASTHQQALDHLRNAAKSRKAAAILLGSVLEEGREEDSNSVDGRKRVLLKAAKCFKKSSPSTGLDHPCRKRGLLLEYLARNVPESCKPGYFLAAQLFRKFISDKVSPALLQSIVTRYLTAVAEANQYPPTPVSDELAAKISQFLLDPFRESAVIGFMQAQETGEASKGGGSAKGDGGDAAGAMNPFRRQLQAIQIHQHLKTLHMQWTQKDAKTLVEATRDFCKAVLALNAPFEKDLPIDALETRINKAITEFNETIKESVSKAVVSPQEVVSTLKTKTRWVDEWRTLLNRAEIVFLGMEPALRSLQEQEAVYCATLEALPKLGSTASFQKGLEIAILARSLLKDSMQPDDALSRHIFSAIALMEYATRKALPVFEARTQLEIAAKPFLKTLPANLSGLCILGYDVLRDIPSLSSATSTSRDQGLIACDNWREKHLKHLLDDPSLNAEWLDGNEDIEEFITESDEPATLTSLFLTARKIIDEKIIEDSHHPRLNLKSVTYNDPWQPFLAWDCASALKDEQLILESLEGERKPNNFDSVDESDEMDVDSAPRQGARDELYHGVLDSALIGIRQQLIEALPDASTELESIFGRLADGYDSSRQNLTAKQKMLTMLKSLVAQHQGDLSLVARFVNDGMAGRCPDGQASFVDTWIFENQLVRALEAQRASAEGSAETITRGLQLHLGLLMADIRQCFIQRHCTPFVTGANATATAEARTAMHVLMTQLLRLPLSLPGTFSVVLYPGYSNHALKSPKDVYSLEKILNRFIHGGSVTFSDCASPKRNDSKIDFEVKFDGLSLETLGAEVRRSILDTEISEARAKAPDSHVSINGIRSIPSPSFVIPEKVVQQFLRLDPVVGPFLATFESSFFTQSNIFFDSEGVHQAGGKVLRNTMRDAAVLRLLEVAGYAIVPDNFYNNLDSSWRF